MKNIFVLFALCHCLNSFSQVLSPVTVLTGVNIIDAHHHVPAPGQTVIIRGTTIDQIFKDGSRPIPDSAVVYNLHGKYLIPGLIDTHVHLATDPSGSDTRSKILSILQNMLMQGITSVRDMAGDGRTLASLSRDAFTGDIVSPDIYYSALMAGPSFFNDPRTMLSTAGGVSGQMPYMLAVSDSTDLRMAVAAAKGSGASGIKLYKNLAPELVTKILREAKAQSMPVWAHAFLFPAKPSDIVKAGVGSISHSPLLLYEKVNKVPESWKIKTTDEKFWNDSLPDLSALFQLMIQQKVILDATLITYKKWADEDSAMRYEYEITKRLTAKAYRLGVNISAGTDDDQTDFVPEEMKLLVKDAGMSAADALDAATINAAKAICISKKTGTIEVNKSADLVVLEKNPLSDIDNVHSVYLVFKAGKIFRK